VPPASRPCRTLKAQDWSQVAGKSVPKSGGGNVVVEMSNAMVALHREYFGRGPSAAKSFVGEEMAVCVLSDIYTPVERTLIESGQAEHVRQTRGLHQKALKGHYKTTVEEILGRPVEAFMSVVHVEPDIAIEVFLLGDRPSA
jgi:uncharacterized protein YbcI